MNKQKPGGIGWCDYTWGPVTGCWGPGGTAENPNRCSYCYAKRVAKRFSPWDRTGCHPLPPLPYPSRPLQDNFQPLFWPERLSQPAKVKKPSKIFVCSMGDLFGDWVPENWINAVFQHVERSPQHTFQFLTKNPKRLKDFNPWPPNCWVGTTVTNQEDADERVKWLMRVKGLQFISHEPLLGPIDMHQFLFHDAQFDGARIEKIDWAIIGAQTGLGAVKPEVEWVMNLAQQYRDAGVPLFLKDNLGFSDQPQEFPAGA